MQLDFTPMSNGTLRDPPNRPAQFPLDGERSGSGRSHTVDHAGPSPAGERAARQTDREAGVCFEGDHNRRVDIEISPGTENATDSGISVSGNRQPDREVQYQARRYRGRFAQRTAPHSKPEPRPATSCSPSNSVTRPGNPRSPSRRDRWHRRDSGAAHSAGLDLRVTGFDNTRTASKIPSRSSIRAEPRLAPAPSQSTARRVPAVLRCIGSGRVFALHAFTPSWEIRRRWRPWKSNH